MQAPGALTYAHDVRRAREDEHLWMRLIIWFVLSRNLKGLNLLVVTYPSLAVLPEAHWSSLDRLVFK